MGGGNGQTRNHSLQETLCRPPAPLPQHCQSNQGDGPPPPAAINPHNPPVLLAGSYKSVLDDIPLPSQSFAALLNRMSQRTLFFIRRNFSAT